MYITKEAMINTFELDKKIRLEMYREKIRERLDEALLDVEKEDEIQDKKHGKYLVLSGLLKLSMEEIHNHAINMFIVLYEAQAELFVAGDIIEIVSDDELKELATKFNQPMILEYLEKKDEYRN